MSDFYCGSCGKHKDDSLKMKRKAGKTPICKTCIERQLKHMARKDTLIFHGKKLTAEHVHQRQLRKAKKQYLTGAAWIPK